jgi:hypothetical protein
MDSGAQPSQLGAGKSARGRPRGHTGRVARKGRAIREAIDDGTPLNFVVECYRSLGIACDAKTLRRWMRAAEHADDLPPAPRRSSSTAVAEDLGRYHQQSQAHRDKYGLMPGVRDRQTAAFWESEARRLTLYADLKRAMASASGEAPVTAVVERQAADCTARAEQLAAGVST